MYLLAVYLAPIAGILKMNIAGMVFKAKTTGVEVKVYKSELMTATWMRVARGNQLTLKVKGGNMVTFDNFRTAQKEQMMEFMKENFEKATVSTEEPSVCGWNWGNTLVHGSYMRMMVKDKCAFEIPLSAIEAAQSASKHEASVQFEIEEGSNAQQLESMRFHFTAPPDDEIEDESRPDQFVKEIMAKIDVTDASESIAKLDDIMCMTPRGKYDFEFFPTHLALHGKTFDFKVLYTSIVRMFLLDKPDQATNFFVLQVRTQRAFSATRWVHLETDGSNNRSSAFCMIFLALHCRLSYHSTFFKRPIMRVVSDYSLRLLLLLWWMFSVSHPSDESC